MRHSDISLTMVTYTDPKLLDVQGALDALPSLLLNDDSRSRRGVAKATGTGGKRSGFVAPPVAPAVAPTTDFRGQIVASADTSPMISNVGGSGLRHPENLAKPSKKASSAGIADKASQIGMTGFEPATSTSRTQQALVASNAGKEVTATENSRCTTGCTSTARKPDRDRPDPVPPAMTESEVGGFAKALLMIASLPLSDADKADAVRRLLLEQASAQTHGERPV